MLGVYKRLLLFPFQLQMLQHLSGKCKKDCVLKKKLSHPQGSFFFVCNDSTVEVVNLWGEETLIWISSWFSVLKH